MKAIKFAFKAKCNEIQKYSYWLKFYHLTAYLENTNCLNWKRYPYLSSHQGHLWHLHIFYNLLWKSNDNRIFERVAYRGLCCAQKKTLISIRAAAVESTLSFSWDKNETWTSSAAVILDISEQWKVYKFNEITILVYCYRLNSKLPEGRALPCMLAACLRYYCDDFKFKLFVLFKNCPLKIFIEAFESLSCLIGAICSWLDFNRYVILI